jgi:hypothetical protein
MKVTKLLPLLYVVWFVLTIIAYNFVVNNSPRGDATCDTYQNGIKISSRPCSKSEYNFSRLGLGEAVVLGFVALIVYRPGRRAAPPFTPNRYANLSLILGLLSIPAIALLWAGFIIAILSILCAIAAFRSTPAPDQPFTRGAKIKAVLGILFSLATLAFITYWFFSLLARGGFKYIIPTLRTIPLPKF